MSAWSDGLDAIESSLLREASLRRRAEIIEDEGIEGGWSTAILQSEDIPSRLESRSPGVIEEALVRLRAPIEGVSPEGGTMASTDTINTMRASGGFTLPEGFKSFLPLILAFILVIFIILKK